MKAVEAWQMPLFVTLGIVALVGLEWLASRLLQRAPDPERNRKIRTIALGVLALLAVALVVVALGPSLADKFSSVAAGMAGVVTLWLTIRSAQGKNGQNQQSEKSTEG